MTKTKTFTLGGPYLKDIVNDLNDYLTLLKKDDNLEFNSQSKIQRIDSYISLLKMTPWNEGGYCQDDI